MKKELDSKSRRKWVIGGLCVFGGLGLLTTGFASWIIGVQVTSADHQLGLTVDTATNSSVRLTMEMSESAISVSEFYNEAGKTVTSTGTATDFDVTFSSVKVAVSQAFLDENTINNISFAIDYTATGVAGDKTANNKLTLAGADAVGRTAGDYTYLDLADATTIDLSSVNWTALPEEDGFKTNEITTKKITMFKWGTYFGNVSPCTYYNALSVNWDNPTINAVKGQMDDLKTAFDGGKIVVKATLNYVKK